MYYLKDGLGAKKGMKGVGAVLAVLFSLFCLLASFGIGNMSQINSIAGNMKAAFHIPTLATGIILMILAGLVILGGIKRIASVTEKLVPVMAVLYIVGALVVCALNINQFGAVFASIFKGAFAMKAVGGGIVGSGIKLAITWGMKRGVFSNEAGLGSAPIAAGSSNTNDPVRQGLISMTGTFIDTLVLCTMTGLVLIVMGSWRNTALEGVALTLDAFARGLWFLPPGVSDGILAVSLSAFAFTTILGWCFYGERSVEYLTRGRFPGAVKGYRAAYLLTVFLAPYVGAAEVWTAADVLNAMMALPNLIALFGLAEIVSRETMQRLRGNPPK